MLILLPCDSIDDSAKYLHTDHLISVAANIRLVLQVLHEEHANSALLSEHPIVKQYADYPVFLCNYGLQLVEEHARRIGRPLMYKSLYEQLEHELDLATTAEFTMDTPAWIGSEDFHKEHRMFLMTFFPQWYATENPADWETIVDLALI